MEQVYECIEKIHQGDKKQREQFIMDNMGLVISVVRRFSYSSLEQEELIQIGSIGLIKAIDHFDTSYQVCFSTYAVPMIYGEIRRFLRDNGPLKVSRSILDNQRILLEAKTNYEDMHGSSPSMEMLGKMTGLSTEEIVLADGLSRPVVSLYEPVYESEGNQIPLMDQLQAKEEPVEDGTIHRTMIEDAVDVLDEKEKRVIILRYYMGKTQVMIAKELSMTQVQVSRMEKRALLKMRKQISEDMR